MPRTVSAIVALVAAAIARISPKPIRYVMDTSADPDHVGGNERLSKAPHYIPEQNPFVDEMTITFGMPRDAALGVPETTYPEYRKKMKKGGAPPSNQ